MHKLIVRVYIIKGDNNVKFVQSVRCFYPVNSNYVLYRATELSYNNCHQIYVTWSKINVANSYPKIITISKHITIPKYINILSSKLGSFWIFAMKGNLEWKLMKINDVHKNWNDNDTHFTLLFKSSKNSRNLHLRDPYLDLSLRT